MIEFHAVHKRYGTTQAVTDVSCTIPRGATVGLIGPNGSGKTTLLRMLVSLIPPTSGDITIDGVSVCTDPANARRHIGYMPDSFGVYEAMTAAEYLDFYARCDEIPATSRTALIPATLARIGLADSAHTNVMSLSRGMAQRLSLGRALLRDPDILVLDEPASGLDPRARIELRTLLHTLHEQGKTILISSHILSDLADLCTHMLILAAGKTVAYDTIDALTHAASQQNIHLQLAAPHSAVETIALQQGYTCRQRSDDPLRYELSGDGSATSRAALLHALVVDGVAVASYSAAATALEQAFLHLTTPRAPEVSHERA